jgi:hypothetical protein
VFDVFTPPVIFYNAQGKTFTVKPPEPPKVELVGETVAYPFDVQLSKVEQPAFRAQLLAVQGNVGRFSVGDSGETVARGKGEFIPGLSLEVVSLEGKRVKKTDARGNTIFEETGTAVLRDLQAGNEVTLKTGERLLEGAPSAIIRTGGAEERRVRIGDTLTLSGKVEYRKDNVITNTEPKEFTYTVDSLTLVPATVVITRVAQGETIPADKRTLEPSLYTAPIETGSPESGMPPGFSPFGPPQGFGPPPGFVPPRPGAVR